MTGERASEDTHRREQPRFEAVFRDNGTYVWRVLRRLGVAEGDLPDMCQNVFLIVHRKLHQFEGRASIRTWLYRICIRVAADYRKRAHRRYEQPAETWRTTASPPRQARRMLLRRMAEALDRALEELPEAPRQVFVLYELEELPMEEVAAVLGCPVKTAYSRLYNARRRVAEALSDAGWLGGAAAVAVPGHWVSLPQLGSMLRACHDALPTTQQLASVATQAGNASQVAAISGVGAGAKAAAGWLVASALAVMTAAPGLAMPEGAVLVNDAAPATAAPRPPRLPTLTGRSSPMRDTATPGPQRRARGLGSREQAAAAVPDTVPSPTPIMQLVHLPASLSVSAVSSPSKPLSFDLDSMLDAPAAPTPPAMMLADSHRVRPLPAARPASGWLDRSLEAEPPRELSLLKREIGLVRRVLGQMRVNDPRRPEFLLRLSRLYQELERHQERVVRRLDEDIACACGGIG